MIRAPRSDPNHFLERVERKDLTNCLDWHRGKRPLSRTRSSDKMSGTPDEQHQEEV
jgi:hypothetical protein